MHFGITWILRKIIPMLKVQVMGSVAGLVQFVKIYHIFISIIISIIIIVFRQFSSINSQTSFHNCTEPLHQIIPACQYYITTGRSSRTDHFLGALE